jgi:hypothetical protein
MKKVCFFRPGFSKSNFAANVLFEVRIEVHENEYRIFFNGNQLSKTFPHREPLKTANHGGYNLIVKQKLVNNRVQNSSQ